MKALHTRLDRLEQQASSKVVALRWLNPEFGDAEQDPNYVHISGSNERMTVAEFEKRYPTGTLINIVYDEHWRD
jgi:hypothetical protein